MKPWIQKIVKRVLHSHCILIRGILKTIFDDDSRESSLIYSQGIKHYSAAFGGAWPTPISFEGRFNRVWFITQAFLILFWIKAKKEIEPLLLHLADPARRA
jgi:hypothetical protein